MSIRWKKWLRRLGLLIPILAILVVVLGWIAPVVLKPHIEREAEEALGLDVRFGAISGNALLGVTLVEVRIRGRGDAPMVRSLAADRIEVGYSLLGWMAGSPDWIQRVDIDGPELDLDVGGTAPSVEFSADRVEEQVREELKLPVLPAFNLTGGCITLRHRDRALVLETPSIHFRPAADQAGQGRIHIEKGRWIRGGEERPLPPFSAEVAREKDALVVSNIRVKERGLDGDRIRIAVSGGILTAGAGLTLFGGKTRFHCTHGGGRLSATLEAAGIQTGPVASILGRDPSHFHGSLDVTAGIEGDPGRLDTLKGAADIAFKGDRLGAFTEISAETRVNLVDGTAHLTTIAVQSREGAVKGTGTVGFDGRVKAEFSGDRIPLVQDVIRKCSVKINGHPLEPGKYAVEAEARFTMRNRTSLLDVAGWLEQPGPDRFLLTLNNLDARIGDSHVAVRGPWTVSAEPGLVKVVKSDLTLLHEKADVRGRVEKGVMDVAVAVAALNLQDVFSVAGLDSRVEGTTGIDLAVSGTPSAPEVRGTLNLEARRMDLSDLGLPVIRNMNLRLGLQPGVVRIETLKAEVEGGEVQADGRIEVKGALSDPALTARVHMTAIKVAGWPTGEVVLEGEYASGLARLRTMEVGAEGLDATGVLDLPARLSLYPLAFSVSDREKPAGALTIQAGEMQFLQRDVPGLKGLEADLSLGNGVLHLRKFMCAMENGGRIEVGGRIGMEGFRPATMSCKAAVRAFDLRYFHRFLDATLEGTATGRLHLSGPVRQPDINADLSLKNARYREFKMNSLDLHATADVTGVQVKKLNLETEAGTFSGKGLVPVRIGLDHGVAMLDRNRPLALTMEGTGLEVGRFIGRVGPVRKIEGPLALNLTLTGTVNQPKVLGEVNLLGMTMKFVDEDLPRVDDLKGKLRFTLEEMEAHDLSCMLGHERVAIEAGVEYSTDLRGAWEEAGRGVKQINLAVKGRRLLLMSSEDYRCRSDVDLRFKGDLAGGTLSGTVTFSDSWYLRDIPTGGAGNSAGRLPLPELTSDFCKGLNLNVRVHPGRGILVDTNLARVKARPDLTIGGTANKPTLTGQVFLDRGKLFTPTQTFDITLGEVSFFNRDPMRPYINLVAETQIAGIEVRVLASGPTDRLNIELTSNPTLPREDIAALIGLGAICAHISEANMVRLVGTKGLMYLFENFFPRRRGVKLSFFADLLDRIYIESIPARTPADSSSQIRAQLRLLETLYIRGESDKYGDHNLDLLLRLKFGGKKPPAGKTREKP